ncbi:glycosyltransferase family 4 protein [Salimicrobium salexigens]|uniref:Glycosyltransferase involved in cell wall bisynthesis n=1 Tax=Salimicrobium salexigens TaxID=908941 RepID=A0ABY1KYV2_9BACI|nr:glycosyltransferase [Salimicrobium salexigens]SIS82759.1 Glycosyltransferase involved in cell wall bisynthesis [Salimicrobium salexigens]
MEVLFCHDGPLRKDEQGNYYGTAHNDDTFKRYYNIADNVSVAIRVNDISKSEAKKDLSKITVSPFEVVECPNVSSLKGILIKRKKTREIIKEAVLNSDYVVVRLPSVIGFIGIDFAKKLNKPYLVEMVACPWDAFWNHSWKGKVVAPFMYFATKKRVKNARYTVYVTNNFLQNRYPTKGEYVNCSNVSLNNFDDSVYYNRINKIKNLNDESKIIIGTTAAVNVRYKGQKYIIEALGELKKSGIQNFEYQLVGGGDQSYLKSIAEKHNVLEQVKFFGSMPHSKVFDWLERIDIYAQPSRQEGLPRGLIEAMSKGLPAFGANTAGIPELLNEDFIFSNTKRNIKEICDILISFDKNLMLYQAEINFEESKKYNKETIEERRRKFFSKFKETKS